MKRSSFALYNLRETPEPDLLAGARSLWQEEVGLDEERIRRRLEQLLIVAVDPETSAIAGVSTSFLATPPRLEVPMWNYRTFVAGDQRQRNAAFDLFLASFDWHQQRFASGRDTRGLGLYAEIENQGLNRYHTEAHWPITGLSFVGINERGDFCRLRYFEGARLDEFDPGERRLP